MTLLSTYFENAGDDLIRIGVQHQVGSALGITPRWRHVAKSNPLSLHLPMSRSTHAPLARMSAAEQRIAASVASALRGACAFLDDKIGDADALIVAGTPLFYFVGEQSFIDLESTYGGDWPQAVFAERVESRAMPPMIALGVGSTA